MGLGRDSLGRTRQTTARLTPRGPGPLEPHLKGRDYITTTYAAAPTSVATRPGRAGDYLGGAAAAPDPGARPLRPRPFSPLSALFVGNGGSLLWSWTSLELSFRVSFSLESLF